MAGEASAAGTRRFRWSAWKLSPMDIKSYTRWDDYAVARDAMFAASDTAWAPSYAARSDDKKRVRLNIISHRLSAFPTNRRRAKR